MESQIEELSKMIATIEKMQSEMPEACWAWEVLNNLKRNYNNRITHLKRLQREKEINNRSN